MSRVLVVGAGLGGLTVSCRLAAAGHDVVLAERSATVGGKLGTYSWESLTWDTGPSLLILPGLLRDTFDACGGWPEDLQLQRLQPLHTYRLADGTWTDSDSLGPQWAAVLERGRRAWQVSRGPFLASAPTARSLALLALRRPRDLAAIAPGRSLASLGRRLDPLLRDVLWRYASYSGADPRRAPAALAAIPWIEHAEGGWAVQGGLRRIAAALHERAVGLGVRVLLDHPVSRLTTAGGRVTGAAGLRADLVVSAVDAASLYADLLPRPRLVPAGRSYSAFALLLALDDPPPMARHTVLFPQRYAAELDDLRAGRSPRDPAVYVHAPSPGQWFVLLNAPSGSGADRSAQALDLLAARGLDVRDRLRHKVFRTPLEVAAASGNVDGAIYGTTSTFRRPANRSPVPGLFLVGGTAHPGGGIPLVLLSAASVSAMIGPA